MPDTLLRTKLLVPPLRPNAVPRPHLVARLQEGWGLEHRLTLISAPAGFGKTTLLCAWIRETGFPVSWLSLDPADDDPARFFAHCIGALQQIQAGLARDILELLHAGKLPPVEIIAASVGNELAALNEPFLLVLDDFQLIQDRFILQVFEQFLANPPPCFHLALITREDPPLPLARLRAGGTLTEIRAQDLRFSRAEAANFLNETLALSLDTVDVARLDEKTEGWIAGLQLAALSIRGRDNPAALIAGLSGSQRLIASYLTEQVLEQQTPEIRQFLHQTAILDRFNGDLCTAVTGRADGRAVLERLFQANLFLIALDEEREWYRYHRLFIDLLRDQQAALPDAETAACHQRAAEWYAHAGMPEDALNHALAAQDNALAVRLLEDHAVDFLMQGYIKTVDDWMARIPRDWRSQSPRTYLALAWTYLLGGEYDRARPYLAKLRSIFGRDSTGPSGDEKTTGLKADWLVMNALLLLMRGQVEESMAAAQMALQIAPQGEERIRSLAHYALGSVLQIGQDFEMAREHFRTAVRLGRSAGNFMAELMSVINLAQIELEQGRLHLALEIVSPVITRIEQSPALPPISTVLYGMAGEVTYQWHHLEEAQRHFERSLQLSLLSGTKSGTIFGYVSLSRLALLRGDLEGAERAMETAVNELQDQSPDYVREEVTAQQVNLLLARNQTAAAVGILQNLGFNFADAPFFPGFSDQQLLTYARGLLFNSALRVFLDLAGEGRADLSAGIALAGQVIATAFRSHQQVIALEALLLRAQMHEAWGGSDGAANGRSDCLQALVLAEPEGFITLLVEQGPDLARLLAGFITEKRLDDKIQDYADRILEAFSAVGVHTPQNGTVSGLLEPLSARELEVLQLMAEGLKYREVAGRLFISLNTVRFHVKTIYSKLQVNNRTQAIQEARRLQLL